MPQFPRGYDSLFFQSRPIEVYFKGFRSDTRTLQAAGWQLSIEQQENTPYRGYKCRLAMQHVESGILMYAHEPIDIDLEVVMCSYVVEAAKRQLTGPFTVQHVVTNHHDIHLHVVRSGSRFNFQAVDAEPLMMPVDNVSLRDLCVFRTITPDSEILVPPQSVPELLAHIQSLQDPKQKEIRERNKKRDARERLNDAPKIARVEAQIITLAGYR